MIPNSDELLWKARYGYEEGAFSYIEFIDATKTCNEIKMDYIDTLYSYYKALANIERATGKNPVSSEVR